MRKKVMVVLMVMVSVMLAVPAFAASQKEASIPASNERVKDADKFFQEAKILLANLEKKADHLEKLIFIMSEKECDKGCLNLAKKKMIQARVQLKNNKEMLAVEGEERIAIANSDDTTSKLISIIKLLEETRALIEEAIIPQLSEKFKV